MIKKLFIAAFAVFALAACNEDVGPEYTTSPVFSEVVFPPKTLTTIEEGYFKATVSSLYGLQSVSIQYYLDEITDASEIKSKAMSANITMTETKQTVEGRIPTQKVGTKVTYQLFAVSYYGVLALSEMGSYTVEDTISPLPDPEK